MIVLVRVDDRLLHGQMAISWTKHLQADTILIANQAAVNDEFTMMSLRLAKPRGVQIIIQDLSQAFLYLKEAADSDSRIMVVIKNLRDAQCILEQFPMITELNIGGLRSRSHVLRIQDSVALNAADIELCRNIGERACVYVQEIPSEKRKPIQDFIKDIDV
ncbi:MAG: PTS sugar transporter subunit IIB [Erysipelotrichaceae bacterium]|nr:PTS sugar transporter subunit IIB [Erysipelotrichaceae bacterium]